jgi:hypothetical protein
VVVPSELDDCLAGEAPEDDVAERFPDSKAVNDALRALAAVADRKARRPPRRRSATKPAGGASRG